MGRHLRPSYMGSFPQDGEKEQNLSYFFFLWSFTVTKRFYFFKFSQLFWRDYVRCSLKILSFWSQQFFLIFKKAIFLAQNLIFWQSLTLSCDQTFRFGLDLSCSSSRENRDNHHWPRPRESRWWWWWWWWLSRFSNKLFSNFSRLPEVRFKV